MIEVKVDKEEIKANADPGELKSGIFYEKDSRVASVEFNAKQQILSASVFGQHGIYYPKVKLTNDEHKYSCDCGNPLPPCRHVIAALFYFSSHEEEVLSKAKAEEQELTKLRKKIYELPQKELANILIDSIEEFSELKEKLVLKLDIRNAEDVNTILLRIEKIFPEKEEIEFNKNEVSNQLKIVLETIREIPEKYKKPTLLWELAQRIVRQIELNGIASRYLEPLLSQSLGQLIENIKDEAQKQEIISTLVDYYLKNQNSSIETLIVTAKELCQEKEDYQIIINKVEPIYSQTGLHRTLLESLYQKTDNNKALESILESKLEYGLDYWQLAEYWANKGEKDKALHTIRDGVYNAVGRKQELYEFYLEELIDSKDFTEISKVLENKISSKEIGYLRAFRLDPYHKELKKHYEENENYEGQKSLLYLTLKMPSIDPELLDNAQIVLDKKDFKVFKKDYKIRQKEIKKQKEASLKRRSVFSSR